jgi:hypothetical protein
MSDGLCWWCKKEIKRSMYRGSFPGSPLPAGSGYVVCSAHCPREPKDAFTYTHPVWWKLSGEPSSR